jgi:hypothetical protein
MACPEATDVINVGFLHVGIVSRGPIDQFFIRSYIEGPQARLPPFRALRGIYRG